MNKTSGTSPLPFTHCRTKDQYIEWMKFRMSEVGYRFMGATWGIRRDFRNLKKADVVEMAEALRYGKWKDFVSVCNSKTMFVMSEDKPDNPLGEDVKKMNKTSGKIELDPNYWDCECVDNYIHPATVFHCDKCGAWKEDQPDSRVDEVERWKATGNPLGDDVKKLIRVVWEEFEQHQARGM